MLLQVLRLAERLTEALVVEAGVTALRPSSQQMKSTSFSHNSCDYKVATADALSHSCLERERQRDIQIIYIVSMPHPHQYEVDSKCTVSTTFIFMPLRYPMFSEPCQFISYMNKSPLSLSLTSTSSLPSKLCAHNQCYL